eukprot:Opistho-2@63048
MVDVYYKRRKDPSVARPSAKRLLMGIVHPRDTPAADPPFVIAASATITLGTVKRNMAGGSLASDNADFASRMTLPLVVREPLSMLSAASATANVTMHIQWYAGSRPTSTAKDGDATSAGFLTLRRQPDETTWKRRYCVLGNGVLSYWQYPEDAASGKPSLGAIDLALCAEGTRVARAPQTESVRAHTLKVSMADDAGWLLVADTADDKRVWKEALNKTVADLRAWGTEWRV